MFVIVSDDVGHLVEGKEDKRERDGGSATEASEGKRAASKGGEG